MPRSLNKGNKIFSRLRKFFLKRKKCDFLFKKIIKSSKEKDEKNFRLFFYLLLISLLFFGSSYFYFKIKKIKLETADRIENIEIIQEKSLLRISQKLEEEKKKRDNAFIEIFFLDVGRGDAIFINYADRYQLLVDGGMSTSKKTLNFFQKNYQRPMTDLANFSASV